MKSERISGVNEIVGGSPEVQEAVRSFYDGLMDDKGTWRGEIKKSPELVTMIEIIAARIGEFVEKYGGTPLKISPEKVHFLDRRSMSSELISKLEGGGDFLGVYRPDQQTIVILIEDDVMDPIILASLLSHEMIHFSSFQSVNIKESSVQEGDEPRKAVVNSRRTGLGMNDRSKYGGGPVFNGINEAVTEELTQRFLNSRGNAIPGVGELVSRNIIEGVSQAENSDEILAMLQSIQRISTDERMDAETILEMEEIGRRLGHKVVEAGLDKRMFEAPATHYAELRGYKVYEYLRISFKRLVADLYKKNKDDFGSEEDVFNVFANAAMSGRLLPLARLITKTYGAGSFRSRMEMG